MNAPAARTYSAWEQYVGGDGLTVTLAALLALAVAWPIQQARWVANMPPATLVALLGLALAVVLARRGWTAWRAHLLAAAAGAVVVAFSALAMTPTSGVGRVLGLGRELDHWFGGVFTDELRGGVVEFGIFILALLWALGFGAGWHALRRRQGWTSVLVGGLVLSLVNCGDELLAPPTTLTRLNDEQAWVTVADKVPPVGTKVTLRLTPTADSKGPAEGEQ